MSHDQQAVVSNLFSNPALAAAVLYYHSDNIKELLMHITTQLKMTNSFFIGIKFPYLKSVLLTVFLVMRNSVAYKSHKKSLSQQVVKLAEQPFFPPSSLLSRQSLGLLREFQLVCFFMRAGDTLYSLKIGSWLFKVHFTRKGCTVHVFHVFSLLGKS